MGKCLFMVLFGVDISERVSKNFICVEGETKGHLSPFLFLLAAEGFNAMVK